MISHAAIANRLVQDAGKYSNGIQTIAEYLTTRENCARRARALAPKDRSAALIALREKYLKPILEKELQPNPKNGEANSDLQRTTLNDIFASLGLGIDENGNFYSLKDNEGHKLHPGFNHSGFLGALAGQTDIGTARRSNPYQPGGRQSTGGMQL
jgi:hypothetical protein